MIKLYFSKLKKTCYFPKKIIRLFDLSEIHQFWTTNDIQYSLPSSYCTKNIQGIIEPNKLGYRSFNMLRTCIFRCVSSSKINIHLCQTLIIRISEKCKLHCLKIKIKLFLRYCIMDCLFEFYWIFSVYNKIITLLFLTN